MRNARLLPALLALAGLPSALGCGRPAATPAGTADSAYVYRVPERTGDGWETAPLADVGMREAPLVQLMTELRAITDHQVHSVLVVRQGKLVFEEYFPGRQFLLGRYTTGTGFDRDDRQNLASVTKSVTTTLLGIALDQGAVSSVHEPVFGFFPEHADLVSQDPRRGGMTLEHLLVMTSGLRWNDEVVPYTEPGNDMVRMFTSADPIRFALATTVYAAPGTDFEYCNANTNIVGEVVARATGRRLDAFAAERLLEPLGITDYRWQTIRGDVVFASGDLLLRPRDMAKIGQLFLNRGEWNGRRVVSSQWVDSATARRVTPDGPHAWADGYGYGWWRWDIPIDGVVHRVYMASGWGGQWIVVSPQDDLVFVSTGESYFGATPMPAHRMLSRYVLRALQ